MKLIITRHTTSEWNWDGVFECHLRFVQSLANENPGGIVLLVGHNRGMSTLLYGLDQTPDLERGKFKILEYKKITHII